LTFHREANLNGDKLTGLIKRSAGKVRMTSLNSLILMLDTEPDLPNILTKKVNALFELVTH